MNTTKVNCSHMGIFITRLAVGAVFVYHGIMKLYTLDMFSQLLNAKLGLPSVFAYIVMIAEIVGGLFLVSGFFVRYAAAILAIDMAVAIGLLSMGLGAPFEYELVLFATLIGFAISGSGCYRIPCRCGTCEWCKAKSEPTESK